MSFNSWKNWVPTLVATLLIGQAVHAEPVNINTADATALANALDGIGPAKAKAIVAYREKNGPFKKIEELMNVRGVGEKNFLKLKPNITVAAAKADHDGPQ